MSYQRYLSSLALGFTFLSSTAWALPDPALIESANFASASALSLQQWQQEELALQQAVLNSFETFNAEHRHAQASKLKVKIRDWGEKFGSVAQVYGQVQEDRENLQALRQRNINLFKEAYDKGVVDTKAITGRMTLETLQYLRKMVDEEVQKIGPCPTRFAIFTMGSMAREETGFITDLEIGFIVQQNDYRSQKYLATLSQRLSDRLFLLGEHPSVGGKGLRIDEADNAPLHLKFPYRYANPDWAKRLMNDAIVKRDRNAMPFEGSRPYIGTPDELGAFFGTSFMKKHTDYNRKAYKERKNYLIDAAFEAERKNKKNVSKSNVELYEEVRHWVEASMKPYSAREQSIAKSFSGLGRNIAFVDGERQLFDQFMGRRERELQAAPKNTGHPLFKNRRQEIAYMKMVDDNVKYLEDSSNFILTGKLGDTIDLKRQLYRYNEQALTNLGFFYKVGTQNTMEIVGELVKRGIMSADFGADILDLLNYATVLRLKEQSILGKQGWDIYLSPEKFEKDKVELEQNIADLKKAREFMVSLSMPQSELEAMDAKIREKQHDLDELVQVAPGRILTEEEKLLLETKYLSIMTSLYRAMAAWLQGDKAAFGGDTSLGLQVKAAPQKVLAPKLRSGRALPKRKMPAPRMVAAS